MNTRIFLSSKLLKAYPKIKVLDLPDESLMMNHINSWNAHYHIIDRKKCWVLTHTKTRYTVFVPDVSSLKIKELRTHFFDAFIKQYEFAPNKIDSFSGKLEQSLKGFFGEFEFYPTNNDKSCISYINQRIEDLKWHKSIGELNDVGIYKLGSFVNELGSMKRNGKSVYIRPDEEMFDLIHSNITDSSNKIIQVDWSAKKI